MKRNDMHYWLCPNCETLNPQTLIQCIVCGDDIPNEHRFPVIKSFEASSPELKDDELFDVSWKTEGAKYVSLNGIRVPSSGSKMLKATEKLLLRASNPNGKVEKEISITVLHIMEIQKFSIYSKNIVYGKKCSISWKAKNVDKVLFEGKEYSADSIITFKPQKTRTFSVTFIGLDGTRIEKDFNVNVIYPDPIITINAPEYANIGQTVFISWESLYVDSVLIDGRNYPAKGSLSFTYDAKNSKKTIAFLRNNEKVYSKQVIIRKAESAQINSCTLSGCRFKLNEEFDVTWSGSHVVGWYINRGNKMPVTQNLAHVKAIDSSFDVHFIGENGTEVVRHFNIEILRDPVKVNYFKSDFKEVQKGDSCILFWDSENVKFVEINNQKFNKLDSMRIYPDESSTITALFHGSDGTTVSRSIHISVKEIPAPVIIKFEMVTQKPQVGIPCIIEWQSRNVKKVIVKSKEFLPNYKYTMVPLKKETIKVEFVGENGKKIVKEIFVDFPPISISYLKSDRYEITSGQCCTLSWSSNNVSYVEIDGTSFSNSGSHICSPSSSKHIEVLFHGYNGGIERRTLYIEVKEDNSGCGCILFAIIMTVLFVVFLAIIHK